MKNDKRINKNNKNIHFPWYDSYWLYSFVEAKKLILNKYPEKYQFFTESFEILKTNQNFKVLELENLFSQEDLNHIKQRIREIKQEEFEKYEFFDFGRIIKHDDSFFNKLQEKICDLVSEKVGEEVECSYNFLSLYNNFGILNPHIDAVPAKWTVDLCVEQSAIWPIYLSKIIPWPEDFMFSENWIEEVKNNDANEFKAYNLAPGNALIFGGSSQWHFRNRIENQSKSNFCNLLFFHFIPKGTKDLCYPKKWADLFEIPELKDIVIDL